ncbi:MAG: prepilin-type N-terminal cleavage/methylation domain-containing protein [Candidatus Omnitrophota bacterium]|jgi:type II secretory pathway pseudopilin PulG
MNKKSFTLLEILLSVLIFALVIAGMANLFVTGKRWISHSRFRMTGSELGKVFLDPLQKEVRQDEWSNNCLSRDGINSAGCDTGSWTDPSNKITYTPEYKIDSVGNLRRVILKVKWQEPS